MFGRNLAEQVRADARGGDREVPIIVEKCVDAVEALGKFFVSYCSSSRPKPEAFYSPGLRGNLSQERWFGSNQSHHPII